MDFTPCGCDRCKARRIENPPLANRCPCPECQPGPGLDPAQRAIDRFEKILGPLTKVITFDFCPSCQDAVLTTSVRSGPAWENTCKYNHTWRSFR